MLHIYFPALSAENLEAWHSVPMNTLTDQKLMISFKFLASEHHAPIKVTWVPWRNMADSRSEVEKVQDEHEMSCDARNKEVLKKKWWV